MAYLRRLVLAVIAGTATSSGSSHQAPDLDFFDDVPLPVLRKAAAKGSHATLVGAGKAAGDALTVAIAQGRPTGDRAAIAFSNPHGRSFLSKGLPVMEPLQGIQKESPLHEELEDPR